MVTALGAGLDPEAVFALRCVGSDPPEHGDDQIPSKMDQDGKRLSSLAFGGMEHWIKSYSWGTLLLKSEGEMKATAGFFASRALSLCS